MAEKVGEIYYEVTLDTAKLIDGERKATEAVDRLEVSLTSTAAAARVHAVASGVAADAVRESGKAADAAAASNSKLGAATEKSALSAKQLTAATRNLPAQFTDIVTSIQAGQAPLTVFLQQGGQLKDMFGGAGAAARAMGTYVTGLISPMTVAAAAVVTFVVGLAKGQSEMAGFTRATELTGGAAGVTADQVNTLAARMDDLKNVTRGQAAEALGVFIETGIRGADSLGRFTEAAIRLEQAGGPAIDKTAQAFKDLEKDPLQASVKLNESVNFLTESLYNQIRSLEQQGNRTEAARVAQEAFAEAINSRTPKILENMGYIERGWKAITGWVRKAGDAIAGIGRATPLADQLEKAQAKLDELQSRKSGWAFGMTAADRKQAIADQQQVVNLLQQQISAGARAASSKASEAAQVRALADFEKDGEKFLEKRARMERDIAQARELGRQAGLSDLKIEERVASIRKAYEEKAPKPKKPKADTIDDEVYLSSLRRAQASEINIINETEDEKLRLAKKHLDARLLTEQTYAEAVSLIVQTAEEDRLALMQKTQAKIEADRKSAAERELRDRERRDRGRDDAREAIASVNPIDRIRFEEEQKIAVLEEYRQRDLANAQLYEDAKAAVHKKASDDIRTLQAAELSAQLQGYGSLFGSVADLTKTFAGEQSGAYKAMFAVSKAFAIADSIVKIQNAMASASMSLPFPGNLGAMATVAASTAGIISTISGTSFGGGRQYGGPVSAGTMYRVNETGKPEMFTAANGNQYMLPTKSGQVTPADKVGGGVVAGGGGDIEINVSVQVMSDGNSNTQVSASGNESLARQLGKQMGEVARLTIAKEINTGGLIWKMRNGQ